MSDAVVLMAYGSPSSADDTGPYLEDIREGRPVSDAAVDELTERYRRIGGRSPLDEITQRQRAALEARLGIPVFVGMKHWRPRIAEAAEQALAGGATRVLGVVLVAPVGFVSDHLEILWDIDVEARERAAELGLELDRIESLNDDPRFIEALALLARGALLPSPA